MGKVVSTIETGIKIDSTGDFPFIDRRYLLRKSGFYYPINVLVKNILLAKFFTLGFLERFLKDYYISDSQIASAWGTLFHHYLINIKLRSMAPNPIKFSYQKLNLTKTLPTDPNPLNQTNPKNRKIKPC